MPFQVLWVLLANGVPNRASCSVSVFAHPLSSGFILMLGSLSPRRYLRGNQSSGGAVKATDDVFTANEIFWFGISRSFKRNIGVLVYAIVSSLTAAFSSGLFCCSNINATFPKISRHITPVAIHIKRTSVELAKRVSKKGLRQLLAGWSHRLTSVHNVAIGR